jgi:hypothetical protein
MSARTNAMLALSLATLALPSAPAGAQPGAVAPRAETLRPDADENLQWAASVVQISELRRQGDLTAKLFGTAGGDPAMNGLYTYLAFFESAGDGWRVFRLGDFLSYRILAEAPGRLTLEVRESVMDRRSGAIGARVRRLAVGWRPGADGEPPALVRLTPAR